MGLLDQMREFVAEAAPAPPVATKTVGDRGEAPKPSEETAEVAHEALGTFLARVADELLEEYDTTEDAVWNLIASLLDSLEKDGTIAVLPEEEPTAEQAQLCMDVLAKLNEIDFSSLAKAAAASQCEPEIASEV